MVFAFGGVFGLRLQLKLDSGDQLLITPIMIRVYQKVS